jgi:hypothetical protein
MLEVGWAQGKEVMVKGLVMAVVVVTQKQLQHCQLLLQMVLVVLVRVMDLVGPETRHRHHSRLPCHCERCTSAPVPQEHSCWCLEMRTPFCPGSWLCSWD